MPASRTDFGFFKGTAAQSPFFTAREFAFFAERILMKKSYFSDKHGFLSNNNAVMIDKRPAEQTDQAALFAGIMGVSPGKGAFPALHYLHFPFFSVKIGKAERNGKKVKENNKQSQNSQNTKNNAKNSRPNDGDKYNPFAANQKPESKNSRSDENRKQDIDEY